MESQDFETLVGLLQERLEIIADAEMRKNAPDRQLSELQRVSEAIVEFHREHKGSMHNRLNHFLENCSFDKALAWAQEQA